MHTAHLSRYAFFGLYAVVATLLCGGVGVGSARADTASSTAPVISSITASSTDTGATITWTTDIPSNSQVAYGTTTAYSASSTLDNSLRASHSVVLSGLSPSTLYHFQVLSDTALSASSTATTTSATTTLSMSADQTFTTGSSSATSTGTTATSTATTTGPTVSNVSAAPTNTTASITWGSSVPATSQVAYGTTTNYGTFSVLDTGLVLNHSITLTNLSPGVLYHFIVLSMDASNTATSSLDRTFTTSMSTTSTATSTATSTPSTNTGTTTTGTTSTTTPTSADISALWAAITQLQNVVNSLQNQLNSLLGGGTTSAIMPHTNASIDQNGQMKHASDQIDFGGHNFGKEEHVSVILSGSKVGDAFTNSDGGFSTGSMSVPTIPGTYTYTFVGQQSGLSATATITVE